MSAMGAMVLAMIAPVLHRSALATLGSADDIGVPAAHREQISPLTAIEDVGVGAVAAGKKI